jgi:DMSO/TMAO reductase YedYZ molybdopterin-dependent catalytic subunit
VAAVKLDPQGYYRRVPLTPERMLERSTPVEDAIVLCHFGVPHLARNDWSLTIDGLVACPLTLRFDDLQRFRKAEVSTFHQCAGSPLQPFEPTRRICNVTWGGVRLTDVLAQCRPGPGASFLWSYGADGGEFGGVAVDAFLKDLPLERIGADVLIAYEMNGAPLAAEHGFPARLVVPGFYGTNSVKWLTRMTLADRRAASPFTTRWYNDPGLDTAGNPTSETTPVWSIAPESLIVAPAPDQNITASGETEIWGWAWADGSVDRVEISTDDGVNWAPANVEVPRGREWQRFSYIWKPKQRGVVTLASLAIAKNGLRQPNTGKRNAIYRVCVKVV